MAFQRTGKLLTAEQVRGGRLVGQIVPLTNGRLDKFSPYLERSVSDSNILDTAIVDLLVYAVDNANIPSGPSIISASIPVSSIRNGFVNIQVEATLPTTVAIILSLPEGNVDNYLSWRYVDGIDSSNEPVVVSEDGGSSWVTKSNRKLSYVAYSHVSGSAININNDTDFGYLPPDEPPDRTTDQSATIQAATIKNIVDDTESEFELQEMDRTVTDGDTIVISFGDFIVTLVVDNSGSMTWNDNKGLRFNFLKTYIQDLENILPPDSEVTFNVIKFNSRKVGKINITLQQDVDAKNTLAGVRVVRKSGFVPVSNPTDGVVIYEGFGEEFLDKNLLSSTHYQYGVFSYNKLGIFSDGRTAVSTTISQPKFPMGVAKFEAEELIVLNGDYDIGKRKVIISWRHPSSDDSDLNYDRIILIRRTDRFPENETDGVTLADINQGDVGYDGPYVDFNIAGPVTDQTLYATAGQTYYYAMFTVNTSGTTCLAANARRSSVKISECDRFWEKLEPPANDPSLYGFNATAPAMPIDVTVQQADKELRFIWTPGDGSSKRYQIYFQPDVSPQLIQDGNGRLSVSGELLYDGDILEFTHRGLDNDQPNFYAIVAYNAVATSSSVVLFDGTAKRIDNSVPPAYPLQVSAEPYNSTSNRIIWKISEENVMEVEGYFGDEVRVQTTVSFSDQLPFINVGTLEIEELQRTAANILPDGSTLDVILDPKINSVSFEANDPNITIQDLISPRVAMSFASQTSDETNSIAAIFATNPLISMRNRLSSISIDARGSLTVRNRSTGELITGIRTQPVSILLKNPFELGFSSDQTVTRRTWSLICDNETSPNEQQADFPGVYVQTGQSFNADLTASFRGEPLTQDLLVSLRILDADTGLPTKAIVLPNSSQDGVVVVTLTAMQDEILDRTGQPTGTFKTVTRFQLTLPPQDVPGDYILEATASFNGYNRIVNYRINYEPSLNIDVDAVAFYADGTSSSEQAAFVYLGNPSAEPSEKQPVADGVVVTWALQPLDKISSANASKRPLYSRDNVQGTGIRSKTVNGTAKKIFFGPATDIGIVSDDPSIQQQAEEDRAQSSCITEGEIYAISATASYRGMTVTSYGFVQLNSFDFLEEDQLNRIFLRLSNNSSGKFNAETIYADGIQESQWEVLSNPASDGSINDYTSGAFFNNGITLLGGQVPILEEGSLVYINAKIYNGSTEGQKVMIRTNLTGSKGLATNASAMVEGGKAVFYVRLNTVVFGKVKQPPLSGEQGANILYGDPDFITYESSPLIIGLSVRTGVRTNGRTVGFYGGGVNLQGSTPPAFISFQEPLGLEVNQ